MDVVAWLAKLGLECYAQSFRDNEIDADILSTLTSEDLKDLGVELVGHRRKLLNAIQSLPTHIETHAGEPISASEAERRHLTVFFCDLVGSTALSARLDPEDMRGLIRTYQDTCAAVIERFEGFVAKFMGDGVLAYFGYPRGLEDAAVRAVHAGLTLTKAIARQLSPLGEPLAVRIGIATGIVVVGDLIGQGASLEQAVVGETPNLAARLLALAAPGTVIVSSKTRSILGHPFEYEDLGERRLKGFSEPVQVWRVVGAQTAESRFEAAHTASLTALVGRNEELEALSRRWQRAKAGEGQVVLLCGEPGIGKSCIAQAFRESLRDSPHIRMLYQCSPYFINTALHPVIEQLNRAGGFGPHDPPERKLERLEATLALGTDRARDVTALLANLLSIPLGTLHRPVASSPEELKEKTLAALLDQMEGLAARQPSLLVFEDVHWIDPTSQELLDRCVDRVQSLPVLLIITFRPDYSPPWAGAPHVTLFTLNRMESHNCAAIVRMVTGGKPFPDEVLRQIISKTDGIPLFVEELTKTVIELSVLREEPDRFVLDGPLPPLAISSSLHDSLMARIDRMGSAKQVAQAGAAIGREFSHDLLAAVLGMPEPDLATALAQLTEAALIFRRGTALEACYTFKHALVRDAAYESLLKSRRQEVHTRIAGALEERRPDIVAAKPELLAHHLTNAGLPERAIPYWQRAGEIATQRSAHVEAIALFNRGVELARSLADSDRRDVGELALLLALGPSLMLVRTPASPAVHETYEKARRLSDRVGSATQQFTALWGLMHVFESRSQWQAAHQLGDEMMDLAARQSDRGLLLQAHHGQWSTLFFAGEVDTARRHAEEGSRIYDRDAHRHHAQLFGGHDPGVCARNIQGMCLSLLGFPDQARNAAASAIKMAEDVNHPATTAYTNFAAAFVYQNRRDPASARRYAEVTVAIGDAFDAIMYMRMGAILVAWAKANQGDAAAGAAELDAILAAPRAKGRKMLMMRYYLGLFADACLQAGRIEDGLAAIAEASETAAELGEWVWGAELLRLKGELLLARAPEEFGPPEGCFYQSIEFARRQSAKTLELRSALALAQLWRRQGRPIDSRELLSPVYTWFTEGFDAPDLKDAKALLDQLA